MAGLMTALFQPLKLMSQSIINSSISGASIVRPDSILLTAVRTKVRCYFPRPNEVRRVRRHGWQTRISTPNGRKVIMRRLLKGRHVLTH